MSGATGVDGGSNGGANTQDGSAQVSPDASNTQIPDGAATSVPCEIAVDESFAVEALPEGFAIDNEGTSFTWQWQSGTGKIPNKTQSASGAGYYLVNSYEKGTPYDARLVSPVFQVRNCASLSLAFSQYLSVLNSNIDASVEVRTGGNDWQNIQTWSEDHTGQESLDLSAPLNGATSLQIAFRYLDPEGQGIYWQIDDVKISAQP